MKLIKTHRANFKANKPLLKYFSHSMFDDYISALTSWNIFKVLRGAYPSVINIYTAHKPDKRFSSNFQCEFRKYYPLQIWFDFKSTGPLFRVLELVHELLGQTSYIVTKSQWQHFSSIGHWRFTTKIVLYYVWVVYWRLQDISTDKYSSDQW